MQRPPAITHHWFSLFRVRSPLLTESLLFSLPVGTEMFHFPTFPPRTLCVQMRVTGSRTRRPRRGFPIRTSWDQSSVINSPRLIADSHVLLRLLMPRHPPCALKNLTTKDQKTLRENQARTQSGTRFYRNCFFLRCSRPLCSSQPTTPSHPHPAPSRDTGHSMRGKPETTRPAPPGPPAPPTRGNTCRPRKSRALLSQDPTVCQTPWSPSAGRRRSRRTRHQGPPRRKD